MDRLTISVLGMPRIEMGGSPLAGRVVFRRPRLPRRLRLRAHRPMRFHERRRLALFLRQFGNPHQCRLQLLREFSHPPP